MAAFNYRHLYYFWVVAKEGGFARAAERLGMAVQTVSTQVRELEQALGCALLKPAGRGLVLTEAGMAAMRQADQIFQLGEALPDVVRHAAASPGIRLAVGIPDGLGARLDDDGNVIGGDGCSPSCSIEAGYTCGGEPKFTGTTAASYFPPHERRISTTPAPIPPTSMNMRAGLSASIMPFSQLAPELPLMVSS